MDALAFFLPTASSEAMSSVHFAAAQGLPRAGSGLRLRKVGFRTCPGSDLAILVVRDVNPALDAYGVPADAWWVIRCSNLPDRTMRLFRGAHSLKHLLRRYGFLDATGCVNHRDAIAEYEDARRALPHHVLRVPAHLQDATGVPQFYRNSGVCWYATMCWSSFANPAVRDFLTSHMSPELREKCEGCLHSRDSAEQLRKRLWYDFAVGDDVEAPPEMDGCNGFKEFSVLCAKLGVPVIRYREQGGRLVPLSPDLEDHRGKRVRLRPPKTLDDPHLLVLRYQDGDHHTKHPILRRILHGGRRYRLLGLYMGQRKCGHQIGACSPSGHWRDWSLTDADLHTEGCGPIYVYFDGDQWRERWWAAWRELVHVTKFGREDLEFCNLSPHNERDDLLDAKPSGRNRPGQNSIDVVYVRLS